MGGSARGSVGRVSVTLRDATAEDVPAVVAIERASFSDPWIAAAFVSHLDACGSTFLVVVAPAGGVAGYAIGRWVADEAELLTIAVRHDQRGSGIASALLDAVIARCALEGARSMTLEVRESNSAARRLYGSHGFHVVSRRIGYYRAPAEDALLMRASMAVRGRQKERGAED